MSCTNARSLSLVCVFRSDHPPTRSSFPYLYRVTCVFCVCGTVQVYLYTPTHAFTWVALEAVVFNFDGMVCLHFCHYHPSFLLWAVCTGLLLLNNWTVCFSVCMRWFNAILCVIDRQLHRILCRDVCCHTASIWEYRYDKTILEVIGSDTAGTHALARGCCFGGVCNWSLIIFKIYVADAALIVLQATCIAHRYPIPSAPHQI